MYKMAKNCMIIVIFQIYLLIHSTSCTERIIDVENREDGSFEIPIYRRRLIVDDKMKNNEINDLNDNVKPRPNPWKNETISLRKFMDSEYYGVIRIGNPAKEFKMIFDTTWADSWVPSEHCGLLEIACMIHNRYDSSKSSTYQEDGTPYKTGNAPNDLRGIISRDDFNLAHMTVKNQSFAEMTHIPSLPYIYSRADGIVGLAFPSLRVINAPTFFNNMLKQSLLKDPVFTFYFNRDPTTERAGRLILGSTERKYVNGSLTKVPVIEKMYWKINMDRVTVDKNKKSYQLCANDCQTIFDTSTNTITGPTDDIIRLNDLIGAKSFVPSMFKMPRYMVNCREYAKLPPIVFTISGEDFTITSKYYIQHLTYESVEVCLSPFVPSNDTLWILGGAFLMEFYTEYNFDTAQILIGQTKF